MFRKKKHKTAYVPCRHCGQQMYYGSKRCVHCGHRRHRDWRPALLWIVTVLLGVMIIFWLGSNQTSAPTPAPISSPGD